ncbi:MAG TPA: RNA 2',3'-cyclic phosphodiesterase [Solirubrobacteraceae bacterium]|jgi:2'-5' RNA ligase|nr:RNA 2',3'-cyclic phosphodiesterase [Solirubrobacteraceae bacterium]
MTRGAAARLFVAAELPQPVRERLVEWGRLAAAALRQGGEARGALRLLDAESLHLTLCFLGSRPVAEIDPLGRALGPCAEGPVFELGLGAPLWLPPRRPATLAIEVHDDSGALGALQERVGGALAAASGWRPEHRRFRPHVTVARVRGRQRVPGAGADGRGRGEAADRGSPRRERSLPATPRLSFSPPALVLYRSWLDQAGARYEALASYPLVDDG